MPGEKKQNLTAALGRSGSRGPHRLPVPPSGTDCRWLWFGLGAKASQAQCCRWAYEGRGRSVSCSSLRELQVAVPWKCPRPNVPSAVFSSALRQAHRASTPSREQQQKACPRVATKRVRTSGDGLLSGAPSVGTRALVLWAETHFSSLPTPLETLGTELSPCPGGVAVGS